MRDISIHVGSSLHEPHTGELGHQRLCDTKDRGQHRENILIRGGCYTWGYSSLGWISALALAVSDVAVILKSSTKVRWVTAW